MNAGRIVVNTPSSQGAVGGIYNMLHPSLTLGCGTGGKNITTDNVTASHLLNIQRIARRRENQRLMHFDTNLYCDESLDAAAVAMIITETSEQDDPHAHVRITQTSCRSGSKAAWIRPAAAKSPMNCEPR